MKYLNLTLIFTLSLFVSEVYAQPADQDKKPAFVFTENGNGDPFNGQIYRSTLSGAARNGNGNDNANFGNLGEWSVDMVVSEKTGETPLIALVHLKIISPLISGSRRLDSKSWWTWCSWMGIFCS